MKTSSSSVLDSLILNQPSLFDDVDGSQELFDRHESPALSSGCEASPTLSSSSSSGSFSRNISWSDLQHGTDIERAMPFRKDDEAWRCNVHGHGPLLIVAGARTAEARLNASLPSSTFDLMSSLLSKAVLLESVQIRDQDIFLFVNRYFYLKA